MVCFCFYVTPHISNLQKMWSSLVVPEFLSFCALRPICNELYGPVQCLSSFQIQLLLLMNFAMLSIAKGQEHFMERFQFIEIIICMFCRFIRCQNFHIAPWPHQYPVPPFPWSLDCEPLIQLIHWTYVRLETGFMRIHVASTNTQVIYRSLDMENAFIFHIKSSCLVSG